MTREEQAAILQDIEARMPLQSCQAAPSDAQLPHYEQLAPEEEVTIDGELQEQIDRMMAEQLAQGPWGSAGAAVSHCHCILSAVACPRPHQKLSVTCLLDCQSRGLPGVRESCSRRVMPDAGMALNGRAPQAAVAAQASAGKGVVGGAVGGGAQHEGRGTAAAATIAVQIPASVHDWLPQSALLLLLPAVPHTY